MKKALISIVLMAGLTGQALAETPLCSYQAKISNKDKTNSKGYPFVNVNGISIETVARIIRQDRYNYYVTKKRDKEDGYSCVFSDKNTRDFLENTIKNGEIEKFALLEIINRNPTIDVMVYRNYVNIHVPSGFMLNSDMRSLSGKGISYSQVYAD